jgi:hypothetical protein
LEANGPDDPGAFAEFDKWVADRVAQRAAAMAEVMKAAGLTSPLPGLADMKGQGGLDPKLETLKIETHCSERRFGWQVPEFSGWNFGLQ